MKVRIRRYDRLNFVVERFRPGGGLDTRGRTISDAWIIDGYHPNLRRAILSAPEVAVEEGTTGWADVVARLEAVAARLTCLADDMGRDRQDLESQVIEIETP